MLKANFQPTVHLTDLSHHSGDATNRQTADGRQGQAGQATRIQGQNDGQGQRAKLREEDPPEANPSHGRKCQR